MSASGSEGKPGSPNVDIEINGKEIPDGDIKSWNVTRSIGAVDSASVSVTNQNDAHAKTAKVGDKFEIKVGKEKKLIFTGVVAQATPQTGNNQGSSLTINGLGLLYRLNKQNSFTFQNKNDKQIIEEVIGKFGLSLEYKGPSITHKHVYQHNLKALDFLNNRAARIGCHVWGWDKQVFVKQPDFSKTAKMKLSVDTAGILRSFTPHRFPGAGCKKVTVKAWDAEKKELIIHTENESGSKLGSKHASAAAGDDGVPEFFVADEPVSSKQEAEALAKATLLDRNLNFITGQAKVGAGGNFDLAEVVEIEQNAMAADPFNGKYYIMGIKHEHVLNKNADEGYTVTLNLARDAES